MREDQEENNQSVTFSARLRQAQLAAGISGRELAQRSGLSPMAISRYIAGDRMPGSRQLQALASGLGVSLDWLMGESADSQKPVTPAPKAKIPKMPVPDIESVNKVLLEEADRLRRLAGIDHAEFGARLRSFIEASEKLNKLVQWWGQHGPAFMAQMEAGIPPDERQKIHDEAMAEIYAKYPELMTRLDPKEAQTQSSKAKPKRRRA